MRVMTLLRQRAWAAAAFGALLAAGAGQALAADAPQATDFTWYARLDNLTNRLAYSATSILTTTVYPAAPLPGRSLKVGLRVTF